MNGTVDNEVFLKCVRDVPCAAPILFCLDAVHGAPVHETHGGWRRADLIQIEQKSHDEKKMKVVGYICIFVLTG